MPSFTWAPSQKADRRQSPAVVQKPASSRSHSNPELLPASFSQIPLHPEEYSPELPPSVQQTISSPGHLIPSDTRTYMEKRFGRDFSHVRLHTGTDAANSARALGASAYTVRSHIAFGPQHNLRSPQGVRLLAHELTHVVQQSTANPAHPGISHEQEAEAASGRIHTAAGIPVSLRSAPGSLQLDADKTKQPPKAPPKPKHTLKLTIRIADVNEVVSDSGSGITRYDKFTKTIPKDLRTRLVDQVKQRLAFLVDQGFQVTVEYGLFKKADLKTPGNIQVWLVDELDDEDTPGKIMKKLYGYKDKAANAANEGFKNITSPGPGEEFREVGGLTPDQIDDSVPGTDEPVFIKIPQMYSRDEISHYKEKGGDKQEAELGTDEISATTSHEIGHVLRSDLKDGNVVTHAKGNFNEGKQTFPPQLMDTVGSRGGWSTNDGSPSPRLSTAPNDHLTKVDIDKLGGWPFVWDKLVLPNVGNDKLIRKAHVTPDGGMDVWYNFKNIGYNEEEKTNITQFLEGIEMSQANHKWK
jgi:Domain of unknown function (DUF4157)